MDLTNEHERVEQPLVSTNDYLKNGWVVSIRILATNRTQFAYTTVEQLSAESFVVVETARGIEMARVRAVPRKLKESEQDLPLDLILRAATEDDLINYKRIQDKARQTYPQVLDVVRRMGLEMHIVRFEYTLDEAKAIVNYVAEQRVDFRQLLHVLADLLKTRIEMRQIGTRDRSKMVGGIGVCGLPLCCATFLGEFEGISINMAKNQLLALNIQKLSGHCGKLLCCLAYEDKDYTELRKGLPKIGLRIPFNDKTYRIGSINVLSQMVRLDSPEDYQNIPLPEVLKIVDRMAKEQ